MKQILTKTYALALGILAATCIETHAVSMPCGYLRVTIPQDAYICSSSCGIGKQDLVTDHYFVAEQFVNGLFCELHVCSPPKEKNQVISVFGFHQNECVLEAGDITVYPLTGKTPVYSVTKGSFKDSRMGSISVTDFK